MNNRSQCMQGREYQNMNSPTCNNMAYDTLQTMPLAMAYVPWQQWQNVYEGCKGLEQGSIFEELILPFRYASRVCNNTSNRARTDSAYYVSPMCSTPPVRFASQNHCTQDRCNTERRNNHCERSCD